MNNYWISVRFYSKKNDKNKCGVFLVKQYSQYGLSLILMIFLQTFCDSVSIKSDFTAK